MDLTTICDKIYGEGSAESAKTGNVFTRQGKAHCSPETTHGQMQQRWVRSKMYVSPFHRELSLVGLASSGVISACSCESNRCPWAHSLGSAQQA